MEWNDASIKTPESGKPVLVTVKWHPSIGERVEFARYRDGHWEYLNDLFPEDERDLHIYWERVEPERLIAWAPLPEPCDPCDFCPGEIKQVQKCAVCGQTFEPIGFQIFCDICLHELQNVVLLSREGLL